MPWPFGPNVAPLQKQLNWEPSLSFLSRRMICFSRYHTRELFFAILASFASGSGCFLPLYSSLLLCGLDCLQCEAVFSGCWWARWDCASRTLFEFEKAQIVSSIYTSYLYILLLVTCWLSTCSEECVGFGI